MSTMSSAVLDSLARSLPAISIGADDLPWDPPRRFGALARRLELLVTQLSRAPEPFPSSAAAQTALRGVAADAEASLAAVTAYRSRCRIYVLVHCVTLCDSLSSRASSIASWLALLESPLSSLADLRKRASDLSRDFQHSDLRVTENEERVHRTLRREGAEVRESSKAVQSAIILDLARALGIDPSDHPNLAEQIKLLRADLVGSASTSPSERRILTSLEKIFSSWSSTMESCDADRPVVGVFEDSAIIPPFNNFLCPLTKEVMREPVVLESGQTYERAAISHWFDRCHDDGRDPTCPVTGQALNTLALSPNIGLKGAIEEWVSRNIEVQINSALEGLGDDSSCSPGAAERALDNVFRISDEHPSSRYRIRNAGIVGLVVKMLGDQANRRMGSPLRTKALMVMHSMAGDEESKVMMLEESMSRLCIRSLTGSLEKEREYALRLLLAFSYDDGYCSKIATEKGALVLLTSMADDLEHPVLSNLAEEVLKNIEKVEDNVLHLAAAGRFQPLLNRLYEGSEEARIKMANILGNTALTNNGKDQIARRGGKVLVGMLSSQPDERASSLHALHNLSTLDDNASVLVGLGVLPELTKIVFMPDQDGSSHIKYLAASIIANIVSNSGHWEFSFADNKGHFIQSEFIIHRLLQFISLSSSKCEDVILRILCGIASSPQASDLVATHIASANGIAVIVTYLNHSDANHRVHALKLTRLLSERLGETLASELRASNKILLLKQHLLDTNYSPITEKLEISCIIANLPMSDNEVKMVLGSDVLEWTVARLYDQSLGPNGKKPKLANDSFEGLLGLLLHFVRSTDPSIMRLVQEKHLMRIFRDQLAMPSSSRAKRRAILGLKCLSESAFSSVALTDHEPVPPRGLFAHCILMFKKPKKALPSCPLHSASCREDSSFCLYKWKVIQLLIDNMNDENMEVQIAAVEALLTTVCDARSLKSAALELQQLGLFDTASCLLRETRPGELQERLVTLIERFLRVEIIAQDYSTDQALFRSLVEALKHGTPCAKREAQDALTSLRQLSGVGAKNLNDKHGRKNNS